MTVSTDFNFKFSWIQTESTRKHWHPRYTVSSKYQIMCKHGVSRLAPGSLVDQVTHYATLPVHLVAPNMLPASPGRT